MAIVASSYSSGKFEALDLLDKTAIEQICVDQEYVWNEGKLGPARTVECFGWQVLMGNVSLDAVAHHQQMEFTGSALCAARQRLPLSVLEELSGRVSRQVLARTGHRQREDGCFKGMRVFRIDGTGVSLADSPEVRKHFGCSGNQKAGCGFPTARVLLLTGPGGVATEAICSPLRTGDMTHAAQTHSHLRPGDLLLGDGQFGNCGHLPHLRSQQLDGLFPVHHSRHIAWGRNAEHGPNRRWVKSLGWYDQLVEYRKPSQKPKWMNAQQFKDAPQWVLVREIRRQVKLGGGGRKWVTLVTTLTDHKTYPARELVKLMGERWAIEVDLRSLKTTMGMESLRCQDVQGVKKELLMYLIVYNLVRLLMLEAARRQGVAVSRVSFADALVCLRYGTGEVVDLQVNPSRKGRIEPRVVKRRPKPFAVMGKPRSTLRKLLLAKRKNAA
jgi:hypothetical protein